MKIIELAEKQRNNEILPKHIRYEDEDLYFDGVAYWDKEGNNDLWDIIAMNYNTLTHLYDEVEIIGEVEKVKELRPFTAYTFGVGKVNETNIEEYIHKLFEQQSQLIENQNIIIERLKNEK